MKFLIFGGCGFLGSNLASEVIKQGHDLTVYDTMSRLGSENNEVWLASLGKFRMLANDIKDADDVAAIVKELKPDVIFHIAGQVAMTTSLENPRADFETNVLGTFNVLEAVRLHSPKSAIFFSSTNKVYGDLEDYHYKEIATRYICEDFPKGFPGIYSLRFQNSLRLL